ncbi:MAG: prepilin peptidase [Hyphomicrobiaceae bacterium]|nr:prepilin peptidase [Hyphomicrobiaceae bacterium]
MYDHYILMIFPAAMVLASMLDLFTMTIPNKISIVLLVSFIIFAPLTGMDWNQFLAHLVIASVILTIGILLFALGTVGGGDAKLLAVASLWIGYDFPTYMLFVTLAGACLSVAIILYRSILPPFWLVDVKWAMRLHNKKEGIPYAIALTTGALITFPTTPWFLSTAG